MGALPVETEHRSQEPARVAVAALPNDRATLTHMGRVGIRALQQNASAVVARAAAGEVVEITDRGRPVARLVPLGEGILSSLAVGARAARRRVSDLPPPLPATPGQPSLGELLREARAAER